MSRMLLTWGIQGFLYVSCVEDGHISVRRLIFKSHLIDQALRGRRRGGGSQSNYNERRGHLYHLHVIKLVWTRRVLSPKSFHRQELNLAWSAPYVLWVMGNCRGGRQAWPGFFLQQENNLTCINKNNNHSYADRRAVGRGGRRETVAAAK